jgi:hypothetical protein
MKIVAGLYALAATVSSEQSHPQITQICSNLRNLRMGFSQPPPPSYHPKSSAL